MINAHNVVRILSNLVSRRLPSSESTTFSAKDEEVAEHLFDNINTIMNSTTYHFENESTLDYDVNLHSDTEESDTDSDETTMNELDKTDYTINKSDKKNTVLYQYSLEYMNILGTRSTVTSKGFLREPILHILENTWHREVRKDIKLIKLTLLFMSRLKMLVESYFQFMILICDGGG